MNYLNKNYEEILNKYTFLNEIKSLHGEEVEVTEEAIKIYHEYDIYKKDWKVHEYNKTRNQMCMSGAWLYKENENTINIAGDILTAKSAFPYEYLKDNCAEILELYNLFELIYHSLGNCIPWCEGGNLGGGNYKHNGVYYSSSDFFTKKLVKCNQIFNNKNLITDSKQQINQVKYRIEKGFTLGTIRKKRMYKYNNENCNKSNQLEPIVDNAAVKYWICKEWKNKTWADFVIENYLTDMVDEKFKPISFVVGSNNEKDKNRLEGQSYTVIKDSLIQSIKLIVKRGYRIQNHIKKPFNYEEDKKVQEIFFDLGLLEW